MGRKAYRVSQRQPGRRNANGYLGTRFFYFKENREVELIGNKNRMLCWKMTKIMGEIQQKKGVQNAYRMSEK